MVISTEMMITTALTTLIGLVVGSMYRKLTAYMGQSLSWKNEVTNQIDTIMSAQQSTMRATLTHQAEKYLTRGWITPDERAAWVDMHERYSSLGANGLINTYKRKIDELPDKTIDDIIREGK